MAPMPIMALIIMQNITRTNAPKSVSARAVATSLFVMAVALIAVAKGVELLRFEADEAGAQRVLTAKRETEKGAGAASRGGDLKNALSQIDAWLETPGLSERAHLARAQLIATLQRSDASEAELIALTAAAPTAGGYWLDLAIARWRRGAPLQQVLDALQMSNLTHPREYQTMVARALFLMRLWEFLPQEERRLAVNQLAELDGRIEAARLQELQAIVAKKSSETQQELKAEFSARGALDRPWAQALGLKKNVDGP